jgi:MYXO-CTERM domain-containing protein
MQFGCSKDPIWRSSAACAGTLIAAAALLVGAPAFAGGFTVGLSQSTMINSHVPDNNIGGANCPRVSGKTNDNASVLRVMLQYGVPTNLANRVGVINSFSLSMSTSTTMFNGNVGTAAPYYQLQPITVAWNQGGQACTQASGSYQAGAACTGSGATWNHPQCAGGGWGFGAGSNNNAGSGTSPSWVGCTGNVCSDVLGWLNTPSSNNGWQVVSGNEINNVKGPNQIFAGTLSVTWTCKGGLLESPANFCTTCSAAAKSACVTTCPSAGGSCTGAGANTGNSCNDPGPPSLSYTCTCSNPAYTGTGTTSCVDKNECSPNPCTTNGDSAATCMDAMAPNTGHTCNCSTGFLASGGTCLGACGSGPDPCGGGTVGTCSTTGLPAGEWSCNCGSGYITTGGVHPFCQLFDACDASAFADCVTTCPSTGGTCTVGNSSGNTCVDEAPPSNTYHCSCTNPAYVLGTVSGKSACVNKNECAPNNCIANGDTNALCTDHPAPATGYTCKCTSPTLWTVAVVAGKLTCVDTDECAVPSPSPNPCFNGACTNIPNGGGYSCMCDPGFVEINGTTPSPACVHPDACNDQALAACVTSQSGNRCVNDPPPRIGYTCDCENPAYTLSIDGQSCVDKNECATNHCDDEGDSNASCVDARAPKAGYSCICDSGFAFNGVSCVDIDECNGGANPCGHGTCTNTNGGYECSCGSGFKLDTSSAPTCKPNGATRVEVTVTPGSCGCRVGGAPAPLSPLWLLALAAAVMWRRRQLHR